MKPVIDYSIYLVTDRNCLKGRDFYKCLEEALQGGVTLVQLREKDVSDEEFIAIGHKVLELCNKYNVPLLINDNMKVAKAVGAAGVHLGQSDGALKDARELLGEDAIIGISTHNVAEAQLAKDQGADYIGVGALYPTGSKGNAHVVGLDTLKAIAKAVDIPMVGIGGIGLGEYPVVCAAGANGCAMISSILGAEDIAGTVRAMKESR